ncbi:hypothetical protein AB6A40_004059 [Gnathostoma spinigerum]|uniref:EB domain-containing protein n=1 Tax=Gnathostoma spinigerum TaxID=75299 RepID=A0ABD6ECI2_9BILA
MQCIWLVVALISSVNPAFTPCNGKSQLGEACDTNNDCELKGSVCLRGLCRCHAHYTEVAGEKGQPARCRRLPARIGESCTSKCREPLFCRKGQCQCVQRGSTSLINDRCVSKSHVGDRCTRHYDCTSPFSACINTKCVCISGTIQQGSRCVAAPNCPLGGRPGQPCVRRAPQNIVENFVGDADNCPHGQVCIASSESPVGHCCPVVCPLSSHVDHIYSCEMNATNPCPSDSHFCHRLTDGGFSMAVCCRRPCNALAPNALFVNGQCMARGQLNSHCITNEQCGGGESMLCKEGRCKCLEGFHPMIDALTHPTRNPSQTCTRDCQSESLSRDTSCLQAVQLEMPCFIQQQCPKNSGCYRGRCLCKCGYKNENNKCVPLPPPPTTTTQSPPPLVVPGLGVGVPPGGDFLKLIRNLITGAAPRSATLTG